MSYEQSLAFERMAAKGREASRARVADRRAYEARVADVAAETAASEARETARRNGFAVGDRVSGRDFYWNQRRTGEVVEGDLTDGVPVLCDDGETHVLYRNSLEATS